MAIYATDKDADQRIQRWLQETAPELANGTSHSDHPCACGWGHTIHGFHSFGVDPAYDLETTISEPNGTSHTLSQSADLVLVPIFDDWGREYRQERYYRITGVNSIQTDYANYIPPDPPRPDDAIDTIEWTRDNNKTVTITRWGLPRKASFYVMPRRWEKRVQTVEIVEPHSREWIAAYMVYGSLEIGLFPTREEAVDYLKEGADYGEHASICVSTYTDGPEPMEPI